MFRRRQFQPKSTTHVTTAVEASSLLQNPNEVCRVGFSVVLLSPSERAGW